MAENTHISWADHTFNPWIGCTKVGPACDGCYAEALMGQASRFGPARVTWGKPGQRATHSRTTPSNWAKVRKWNRDAAASGRPVFVFCASLADVFDKDVPWSWRQDLFKLIHETPHLTWLLLTKRPGMIVELFHQAYVAEGWPPNAAMGATIVTQPEADRDIIKLLAAKRELKPAFAFLSMEPLLGAVDLTRLSLGKARIDAVVPEWEGIEEVHFTLNALTGAPKTGIPPLDWVITGGETDQGGHKARPQNPQWFRDLRDQCEAAGVAFHHKQNGEWVSVSEVEGPGPFHTFPDHRTVRRVGKDRSGRTIDGVIHDARPEVAA